MFLAVSELERRRIRFDETFPPESLLFSDLEWNPKADLRVVGSAELLDRAGSRTIRVRGRIRGVLEGKCARCVESFSTVLDDDFDLFYYPSSLISRDEEVPIDREDTDIGFYEGPGLEVSDVVKEQILLWLPMRGLCNDNCKGICPHCGVNRNQEECLCAETFVDPRWDALRRLRLNSRQ